MTIVQTLFEKSSSSTPPRPEMVVSPRKRFLREMEKDKQQTEDACQKRSRNKSLPTNSSTQSGSGSKVNNTVQVNGIKQETNSVRNNKYSITSLLAEDHNSHRSSETSPSHFTPVTPSPYCSSDDRWYSESVDRLRSIELSVSNSFCI